jgi:hypothetical protein
MHYVLPLLCFSRTGFDGDEFYMDYWSEIVGLKFGQLPELFPDAIVCGVCDEYNRVVLNPNQDYVMKELDELVVIAESVDSYQPYSFLLGCLEDTTKHASIGETSMRLESATSGCRRNSYTRVTDAVSSGIAQTLRILKAVKPGFDADKLALDVNYIGLKDLQTFCNRPAPAEQHHVVTGENFLIIGWRRDLRDVLVALDEIVGPDTTVYLFDDLSKDERERSLSESGEFDETTLQHVTLVHKYGNPVSRRDLESLHTELNLLQVCLVAR